MLELRRFELRSDVGHRLREWRLRRQLSQAEVARRAGITQASLSNYENGKRDLPLPALVHVASAACWERRFAAVSVSPAS